MYVWQGARCTSFNKKKIKETIMSKRKAKQFQKLIAELRRYTMPKKDYLRLKSKILYDLSNFECKSVVRAFKLKKMDAYDCVRAMVIAHIRHSHSPYDYLCEKYGYGLISRQSEPQFNRYLSWSREL